MHPWGWAPVGWATTKMGINICGSSDMVSLSPQKEQEVLLFLNKYSKALTFWTTKLSVCLNQGGREWVQSNLKEICKQAVICKQASRSVRAHWNVPLPERPWNSWGECFLIFRICGCCLCFYDAKCEEENSKSECLYRGKWVTSQTWGTMVITELFIQTLPSYTPTGVLGGICHSFCVLDGGPIIWLIAPTVQIP